MKQKLLGSIFGRFALKFRDKTFIINTAINQPERVGTVANDQLSTYLVTRLCRPNKTFIDVGAHIGSIISEVAHNDRSISIVAIEAISEKVVNLREKFPTISIFECAVGEATGVAAFYINTRESGYSSLGKSSNQNQRYIKEIQVPVKRLDDIIQSNDVDVIKIDVEGAELGVLKGGVELLRRNSPTIMFESGPKMDDGLGYSKTDIFQFLAQNDYRILAPNRLSHSDSGMSEDEFLRSHLYPRITTNYFAVASSRREEIRARSFDMLMNTQSH